MIFQYTWTQVIQQKKTATRRVVETDDVALRGQYNRILAIQRNGRAKWRVGDSYAVQTGRGQTQIARIRLIRITQQKLRRISDAAAKAEGFSGRQEFLQTWKLIHGPDSLDLKVWILEFELAESASAAIAFPRLKPTSLAQLRAV